MYNRLITKNLPKTSFFLFGPRGTGKTTLLKKYFPNSLYINLLKDNVFNKLLASPSDLENKIPTDFSDWIIIDEVQKIPALLDEVHNLIETRKLKFILTGSSARKLKKEGTNLLAGRAITKFLYPMTAKEIGNHYNFPRALKYGMLPALWDLDKKDTLNESDFLNAYISTYLKEEVQQEGLTRNLGNFSRFLETASFSQAESLNISEVAREASIKRKMAEGFFQILEDLLIAIRIPVFTKRAKRKMANHQKFFFFDTGIYQCIRPKGPLDAPEVIGGAALETLILQELMAHIDQKKIKLRPYYWRTSVGSEVDFVFYGDDGLFAIEVKSKKSISNNDIRGLKTFLSDYPEAKAMILYGGSEKLSLYNGKIQAIPIIDFIQTEIDCFLGNTL